MNEGRENAWRVGTAPHRAVIITESLLRTCLVPGGELQGWAAGGQAGDELRSSRSPRLTQAEALGEVGALWSA